MAANILLETEKPAAAVRAAPFSRGVNFSKWFEAPNAQAIQFTRYVEQDFINVRSLGADVIRLPIKMHNMTLGAPEYVLDPLLLEYLDTAIDWAEKHGLYIIIDNHSFHPVEPTDENIDRVLLKVWAQLALRYKNRSKYVIHEVLNEPHGIRDSRWGEIQGAAIKTIREIDAARAIIVGGTDFNSIGKLSSVPEYDDQNLIYTFHFYDPHLFTHQGAAWNRPSLAPLSGLNFPADETKTIEIHETFKGTWVEEKLKSYKNDSKPEEIRASLDKAAAFSKERSVPVFCGEFGVYMIQSPAKDRVTWYEFVTGELEKRNIPWTMWDYYGGFGLFNTPAGGDFNADLNADVTRALGFTPPVPRASNS